MPRLTMRGLASGGFTSSTTEEEEKTEESTPVIPRQLIRGPRSVQEKEEQEQQDQQPVDTGGLTRRSGGGQAKQTDTPDPEELPLRKQEGGSRPTGSDDSSNSSNSSDSSDSGDSSSQTNKAMLPDDHGNKNPWDEVLPDGPLWQNVSNAVKGERDFAGKNALEKRIEERSQNVANADSNVEAASEFTGMTADIGRETIDAIFDNPVLSVQEANQAAAVETTGAEDDEELARSIAEEYRGAHETVGEAPRETFEDTAVDNPVTDAVASTAGFLGEEVLLAPFEGGFTALTGIDPRPDEGPSEDATDATASPIDVAEAFTLGTGAAATTAGSAAVRAGSNMGILSGILGASDEVVAASDEVAAAGDEAVSSMDDISLADRAATSEQAPSTTTQFEESIPDPQFEGSVQDTLQGFSTSASDEVSGGSETVDLGFDEAVTENLETLRGTDNLPAVTDESVSISDEATGAADDSGNIWDDIVDEDTTDTATPGIPDEGGDGGIVSRIINTGDETGDEAGELGIRAGDEGDEVAETAARTSDEGEDVAKLGDEPKGTPILTKNTAIGGGLLTGGLLGGGTLATILGGDGGGGSGDGDGDGDGSDTPGPGPGPDEPATAWAGVLSAPSRVGQNKPFSAQALIRNTGDAEASTTLHLLMQVKGEWASLGTNRIALSKGQSKRVSFSVGEGVLSVPEDRYKLGLLATKKGGGMVDSRTLRVVAPEDDPTQKTEWGEMSVVRELPMGWYLMRQRKKDGSDERFAVVGKTSEGATVWMRGGGKVQSESHFFDTAEAAAKAFQKWLKRHRNGNTDPSKTPSPSGGRPSPSKLRRQAARGSGGVGGMVNGAIGFATENPILSTVGVVGGAYAYKKYDGNWPWKDAKSAIQGVF